MAGIFTTLRVRDGRVLFLADHLARLRDGAVALCLPPPPSDLHQAIEKAVGPIPDARVRVTLATDGCTIDACAYTPPQEPWTLRPVVVSPIADGPLLKTTDRAHYERARECARPADDALLVAPTGAWLECTIANIFLGMRDGRVLTPPASGPLLPGIVRARVLASGRACEGPLDEKTARKAVACVVTNALFGVHPVREIEGVGRYESHELARGLKKVILRTAPGPRIIR